MNNICSAQLAAIIEANVKAALMEDIGTGDITAQLILTKGSASAEVICREKTILCGSAWVNETFRQMSPLISVHWLINEGEEVEPEQPVFQAFGPTHALVSGERTALNFLQLLSGIASRCHTLQKMVADTGVKLLDTRKTLPGLRVAQKYAVSRGGCHNHRIGLYDAFLIKENHIAACGGISQAVATARSLHPDKIIEVEIETLAELQMALATDIEMIMLDNLSVADIRRAVKINDGKVKLEASGGVSEKNLREVAETGVDYISLGTLTKDVKAADLSMRLSI